MESGSYTPPLAVVFSPTPPLTNSLLNTSIGTWRRSREDLKRKTLALPVNTRKGARFVRSTPPRRLVPTTSAIPDFPIMAGTGGDPRLRPLRALAFLLLSLLLLAAPAVLAKSRIPISDNEIRQKKSECYADVESGLWGWQCKSSMIAKENCALKCLSPTCYEIVYESDPLEEGEKDYTRGQEYKYCMHKLSLGESLEGIRGSFD